MKQMNSSEIHSPIRRALLLALAAIPFARAGTAKLIVSDTSAAQTRLAALETEPGDRLGVVAINTADGTSLSHRATELFPLCSTFKVLAVSAILKRSAREDTLLQHRIKYAPGELVNYSPVTEKHLTDGMTVAELCAAAIQYSDNTAANLLMTILGGPSSVTAFARTIGDREFRLDRWETELNTAIPGDPRDTSTPVAMARDLQRLVLGDALAPPEREQLQGWLRGNTTGAARIRAGVPADWQVGDKTGSGDYGATNHVAVLWPPIKPPIIVALYLTQREKDAKPRNEVLVAATRIIVETFS